MYWCCLAQVQQVVQNLGEQAEPIAKDITRGVIQPGAKAFAETAVPMTEQVWGCCMCSPPLLLYKAAHSASQLL